MGTFFVEAGLPQNITVKALVDTGATFSKIPSDVLKKLHVKAEFETTIELGDGRRIKRKVGYVKITLNGKSAPVPVVFGKKNERPLIGATTLEILGLIPDPQKKILHEGIHLEVLVTIVQDRV